MTLGNEDGTFPTTGPTWLYDGPMILLLVLCGVAVVLCIRGGPRSGWVARTVGALLVIGGALTAWFLWALTVHVGASPRIECIDDPLTMSFDLPPLTGVDRECRTRSRVQVAEGAGAAIALSGLGIALARSGGRRREAEPALADPTGSEPGRCLG